MFKLFLRVLQGKILATAMVISCLAGERPCLLEPTPCGVYDSFCGPRVASIMGGGAPVREEALPSEVDLERMPIKNQGDLGTCASFAVSGIVEFLHRGAKLRVSEAELTVLANTHLPEGTCKSSAGLFLGNVLKIAYSMGCVEETRLPYETYLRYVIRYNGARSISDNREICLLSIKNNSIENYNETMAVIPASLRLTGSLTKDRTTYRIGMPFVIRSEADGKNVPDILRKIKKALHKNNPVAVSIPVFSGSDWDETGVIKMRFKGVSPRGLHAIVLWGYVDSDSENLQDYPLFRGSSGTFLFRNSWGEEWGRKGHGYMPFEYVLNYALEIIALQAP